VLSASFPAYTPFLSFLNATRAARSKAVPRLTYGLRSAFGCFAHNSATASANLIAASPGQETQGDMARPTGRQAGPAGRPSCGAIRQAVA
jgi:hypothetical protein